MMNLRGGPISGHLFTLREGKPEGRKKGVAKGLQQTTAAAPLARF